MCEQTEVEYLDGDIVWVKLGPSWWPGEVQDSSKVAPEILQSFRKPPIAVVKFFDEDKYEYVKNINNIYKYNCRRKSEFIKKGLDMHRAKNAFMDKFPTDVCRAEALTNGDPDIITNDEFAPEQKTNYSTIFGTPSPKKPKTGRGRPSLGNPRKSPEPRLSLPTRITHPRFVGPSDHHVTILEQCTPQTQTGEYTCHICGFSSTRLNVIVLHNRSHSNGTYVSPKPQSASSRKKKNVIVGKRAAKSFATTNSIEEDLELIRKGVTITTDDFSDSSDTDLFAMAASNSGTPKKKGGKGAKRKNTKASTSTSTAANKKAKITSSICNNLLADWGDDESTEETDEPVKKDEETKEESTAATATTTLSSVESEKETNRNIDLKSDDDDAGNVSKEKSSCFDFEDEEDNTNEVLEKSPGRKIPRVIPPKRISKDSFEENLENNVKTNDDVTSGNDGNKVHNDDVDDGGKDKPNQADMEAFNSILEETAVPDVSVLSDLSGGSNKRKSIDDQQQTNGVLKKDTVPQSEITIGPATVTVNESESVSSSSSPPASASITQTPKKRYVRNFEEFETFMNDPKQQTDEHENETDETDLQSKSLLEVSKLKSQLMSKLIETPITTSKKDSEKSIEESSTVTVARASSSSSSSSASLSSPPPLPSSSSASSTSTGSSQQSPQSAGKKFFLRGKKSTESNRTKEKPPEPVVVTPKESKRRGRRKKDEFEKDDNDDNRKKMDAEEIEQMDVEVETKNVNDRKTFFRESQLKFVTDDNNSKDVNDDNVDNDNKLMEKTDVSISSNNNINANSNISTSSSNNNNNNSGDVNVVDDNDDDGGVVGDSDVKTSANIGGDKDHDVAGNEDDILMLLKEKHDENTASKNLDATEIPITNNDDQVMVESQGDIINEKTTSTTTTTTEKLTESDETRSQKMLADITDMCIDNSDTLSGLSTLAAVSELSSAAVIDQQQQAESTADILNTVLTETTPPESIKNDPIPAEEKIDSNSKPQKPIQTLANFSMDFSDSNSESTIIKTIPATDKHAIEKEIEPLDTITEQQQLQQDQQHQLSPSVTTTTATPAIAATIPSTTISTTTTTMDTIGAVEFFEDEHLIESNNDVISIAEQNKNLETEIAKLTDTQPELESSITAATIEQQQQQASMSSSSSSSKLLEILTDSPTQQKQTSVGIDKNKQTMFVGGGSNSEKIKMLISNSERATGKKFDPKTTKFIIKSSTKIPTSTNASQSSSTAAAATTIKSSNNKPIILSEKIIKPITAGIDNVSVKKVTSKRSYQDVEDIDTFIIQKPPKKSNLGEMEQKDIILTPKTPDTLQKYKTAVGRQRGKPKIIEQTIIKVTDSPAASSAINITDNMSTSATASATTTSSSSLESQQPSTMTTFDDSIFDINSMPIVLSDQLLTPESIENMPVVMSNLLPTSTTAAVATTTASNAQQQQTLLTTKKLVNTSNNQLSKLAASSGETTTATVTSTPKVSQNVLVKNIISRGLGKNQKVYQTGSKILKNNPAVITQPGKPGKFIILPSTTASPNTGSKYTVGKRGQGVKGSQQITSKQLKALQQQQQQTSNVTGASTSTHQQGGGGGSSASSPEPTGNKIMIVTNQHGVQSRVLLTPAQQKLLGCKMPSGKLTKAAATGLINKAGGIVQKSILTSKGTIITSATGIKTTSALASQTIVTSKGQVYTTTSNPTLVAAAAADGGQTLKQLKNESKIGNKKFIQSSQRIILPDKTGTTTTSTTMSGASGSGGEQLIKTKMNVIPSARTKTILIKSSQGQTIKKIQTASGESKNVLLSPKSGGHVMQHVTGTGKQIIVNSKGQIIKTTDGKVPISKSSPLEKIQRTMPQQKGTTSRLVSKTGATATATGGGGGGVQQHRYIIQKQPAPLPPLAPITAGQKKEQLQYHKTHETKSSVLLKEQKDTMVSNESLITNAAAATTTQAVAATHSGLMQTSETVGAIEQQQQQQSPPKQPNQLVIQDPSGNEMTVTEGQILAWPSGETVDGQPQSYILITVDDKGNLVPISNDTLMSLDPNLNVGSDMNYTIQIDTGAANATINAIPTTSGINTNTTTAAAAAVADATATGSITAQQSEIHLAQQQSQEIKEIEQQQLALAANHQQLQQQQQQQQLLSVDNQQLMITTDDSLHLPVTVNSGVEHQQTGNNSFATSVVDEHQQQQQQQQQLLTTADGVPLLHETQQTAVAINNGETSQQLIITGDPESTQKFLASLSEGNTDLSSLLSGTDSNIIINADGQQILLNTDNDNHQILLSVNSDNLGLIQTTAATAVAGASVPAAITTESDQTHFVAQHHQIKNQDILAAALADTDVFQQESIEKQQQQQTISSVNKVPSSTAVQVPQMSPNSALYPMNVGNVLETSLTLGSPIMTPLEVPSVNAAAAAAAVDTITTATSIASNNKQLINSNTSSDTTSPSSSLDLPITITDPSISQTVSQQIILGSNNNTTTTTTTTSSSSSSNSNTTIQNDDNNDGCSASTNSNCTDLQTSLQLPITTLTDDGNDHDTNTIRSTETQSTVTNSNFVYSLPTLDEPAEHQQLQTELERHQHEENQQLPTSIIATTTTTVAATAAAAAAAAANAATTILTSDNIYNTSLTGSMSMPLLTEEPETPVMEHDDQLPSLTTTIDHGQHDVDTFHENITSSSSLPVTLHDDIGPVEMPSISIEEHHQQQQQEHKKDENEEQKEQHSKEDKLLNETENNDDNDIGGGSSSNSGSGVRDDNRYKKQSTSLAEELSLSALHQRHHHLHHHHHHHHRHHHSNDELSSAPISLHEDLLPITYSSPIIGTTDLPNIETTSPIPSTLIETVPMSESTLLTSSPTTTITTPICSSPSFSTSAAAVATATVVPSEIGTESNAVIESSNITTTTTTTNAVTTLSESVIEPVITPEANVLSTESESITQTTSDITENPDAQTSCEISNNIISHSPETTTMMTTTTTVLSSNHQEGEDVEENLLSTIATAAVTTQSENNSTMEMPPLEDTTTTTTMGIETVTTAVATATTTATTTTATSESITDLDVQNSSFDSALDVHDDIEDDEDDKHDAHALAALADVIIHNENTVTEADVDKHQLDMDDVHQTTTVISETPNSDLNSPISATCLGIDDDDDDDVADNNINDDDENSVEIPIQPPIITNLNASTFVDDVDIGGTDNTTLSLNTKQFNETTTSSTSIATITTTTTGNSSSSSTDNYHDSNAITSSENNDVTQNRSRFSCNNANNDDDDDDDDD